jgi:hypothetical protein
MKRLDGTLAGSGAGLRVILAGLSAFLSFAAGTNGPAQEVVKNGDVDENGERNLTDAVFLLTYLFLDGTAPVPVVMKKGLPTTGQTECYDDTQVIPCPLTGEPYYGQDATHPGFPHDYEVVKPDPGDPSTWYTIDYSTALMWQYVNDGQRRTWPEAHDYASNLRLGGFDDWRVPNITELLSILDLTHQLPCFDTRAFDLVIEDPLYHTFWTSTTPESNRTEAYVISFKYGTIHYSPKDPGYKPDYVRAVRTIQQAPANGDINGDGDIDISDPVALLLFLFNGQGWPPPLKHVIGLPVTTHCDDIVPEPGEECYSQGGSDQVGIPREFEVVKPDPSVVSTWYTIDHATGLMWQYAEELQQRTWVEALATCEGLELGGFTDWRLPSIKELQSIINYGRSYPAIDQEYFGRESYALEGRDHWQFWSATPWYILYMDVGLIGNDYPQSSSWVRAVRTAP